MLPILVVDDAREDLLLAARIFRQCKILNPCRLLNSGEECLSYFKGTSSPSGPELPCLTFVDMVMSPINGLEVLHRLRDEPKAQGSLIIMLSGLTDIKLIQQGYQLGARTFLVKPIGVEDLMLMLAGLRGLRVTQKASGYVLSLPSPHDTSILPESSGPFAASTTTWTAAS